MCELMRKMCITCLSETKKFDNDVYEIDRYTFTVLHSGHDLPGVGDALQCGESDPIVFEGTELITA